MKKIIFAVGVYDTTDLFSSCLSKAFEKMGFESIFLDLSQIQDSLKKLGKIPPEEIFAAVVFNNLAYRIELEEGVNYWEKEKIPYVNILMDHPFHYKKHLECIPDTAIVICTDKNHVTFLHTYMPDLKQVYFLPHAGVLLHENVKPIKERKIPILYAGSLPFASAGLLVPDLSAITSFDAIDLSKRVLDSLIKSPEQTTEEAILSYLSEKKLVFSMEETYEIIYKMRFLDSYATSYFREQSIRLLVENGFDVTVYGSGWDICEWTKNLHFKYMGKVLAPEVLLLMQDSKIVLHTQTWYKNGAHDRIYNGMLSKACVVSDTSLYLKETLQNEKEIIFFERENIEKLPQIIDHLLCNPDKMQEIADTGFLHAKENHTWEVRAKEIRTIIESCRKED